MKGEEITIKIGAWLIEQAAKAVPDVASDVDPRIHRNIKAMNAAEGMTSEMIDGQRKACAQALGFEDNPEFQAFFKIVHQLWASGRLDLMMEYWENKEFINQIQANPIKNHR